MSFNNMREDPLDAKIEGWEKAIANFEKAQLDYAQVDASFKAWEASIKMTHMRNKASGVMAEGLVRTNPDWEGRYLEAQSMGIKAETAKRVLSVAQAKWETERSKAVSLRNLK